MCVGGDVWNLRMRRGGDGNLGEGNHQGEMLKDSQVYVYLAFQLELCH